MDAEIKREFERLNQKLNALISKEKEETPVKASTIMELTGWNKEGMRRARENGWVKRSKKKGGIFYSLESVPEVFIKKSIA